jgi:hypothetical protein
VSAALLINEYPPDPLPINMSFKLGDVDVPVPPCPTENAVKPTEGRVNNKSIAKKLFLYM